MNEEIKATKSKENKRVLRIVPCPSYDIEGMESWLEELALQGLFLTNDAFFCGFGSFERHKPRRVRYRLDTVPKDNLSAFALLNEPSQDMRELSREMGWEYVATRGLFYIYRCDDTRAVELNSEPEIQAMSLGGIRKRSRDNVIKILLYLTVLPIIYTKGNLLLLALSGHTWLLLLLSGTALWAIIRMTIQALRMKRLIKALEAGSPLSRVKAWRKKAPAHIIGKAGFVLAVTLCVVLSAAHFLNSASGAYKKPLSDFPGEPPFATMEDIFPGGRYTADSHIVGNTYEIHSYPLAPLVIKWSECANVVSEKGESVSGGIWVDYYEACSEAVAKEIVRETLLLARQNKNYKDSETPEIQADYAHSYYFYGEHLIVRNGCKVMNIEFSQWGNNEYFTFDEWAKFFGESIIE